MNPGSRRVPLSSAPENPDRLMTNSYDKQQKLQAATPERSLP
jgi:hypothetical protein